jgi:hypothetical protein
MIYSKFEKNFYRTEGYKITVLQKRSRTAKYYIES